MKKQLSMLAGISALAFAMPASAAQFFYTFTGDGGVNGASGTLTATSNGDGTYSAQSGSINVFGTVANGAGSLIPNPSAPGQSTSPLGTFLYDNQLLPGQDPLILVGGLLFNVGGAEVNIYSNGPGSYTEYSNSGANVNGNFALSEVAAVPEPATWALMLLGFGMIGFAMRKRSNVRTTVSYA